MFRKRKRSLYLSSQKGQGMTEFIVIVALIAIAAILVIVLFGDNIRKQFGKSGNAVGGKEAKGVTDTAKVGKESDEKDLSNFADEIEKPPPQPPPPPLANPGDVMGHDVRHHIGDGIYSAALGGGSLENEGTSFNVNFEMSQDMIDYANQANGGFVYLHYDCWGVDWDQNSISLGGNTIGNIQNGSNIIAVSADSLGAGSHDLTFISQGSGGQYDDFEVSGIEIGYSAE
ncbi:MAG: hypothetical protein KAI43_02890 [Candidatus Aureabacteria bacterium]|nr:hypothetical protein [Candidatus Auribacterota bacterium]